MGHLAVSEHLCLQPHGPAPASAATPCGRGLCKEHPHGQDLEVYLHAYPSAFQVQFKVDSPRSERGCSGPAEDAGQRLLLASVRCEMDLVTGNEGTEPRPVQGLRVAVTGMAHGEMLAALWRHGVCVRVQRKGCPPDVGGVHRLLRQDLVPKGSLGQGWRRRLHGHTKLPARQQQSQAAVP